MLLDTSGLLCLQFQSEPYHQQACLLYKNSRIRLVHSYILAEYVALAHVRRFSRLAALEFITDLLDNPDIEIIWVDKLLPKKWLGSMPLLLWDTSPSERSVRLSPHYAPGLTSTKSGLTCFSDSHLLP